MSSPSPLVAVIMGSTSDWDTMSHAVTELEQFGIPYEKDVVSVDGDQVGVNAVILTTPDGDITVRRTHGGTAIYQVPGQPQRTVALRRRPLTDLLTEELQRMDADDIFEAATRRVVEDAGVR